MWWILNAFILKLKLRMNWWCIIKCSNEWQFGLCGTLKRTFGYCCVFWLLLCIFFLVKIQLIFINSTRLTTQLIESFTVSNSFYFHFPPNHIISDMVFNPRCYQITMNHNLSFALIFNRFVSLDDFLPCFLCGYF